MGEIKDLTEYDGPFKKCKKRPVVVEAVQINEPFKVKTMEGMSYDGKAGDYLMKGIKGELYPCDKEVFEETYDWVE